jgi:hypothetical protein
MPNNSYLPAIREAFAVAAADDPPLDTLEISHPSLATHLYLVKNREDLTLTLETGSSVLFRACGFRMALPPSGDNGLQELTIALDNVDRAVSDFLDSVKTSAAPVRVTYRPYLSSVRTEPQMDPPLVLFLGDAKLTVFEATGRASFADLINKKFPTKLYTRSRFPSLGE